MKRTRVESTLWTLVPMLVLCLFCVCDTKGNDVVMCQVLANLVGKASVGMFLASEEEGGEPHSDREWGSLKSLDDYADFYTEYFARR